MEYKALKDIAKITMGQSPDSSSYNEIGDGLPFFQGNADFGEVYPKERVWCNEPKKVAEPEDILISVRAPIGALNYAKNKCCIGRGLAAISIEDVAERNYVFHLLKARSIELNNKDFLYEAIFIPEGVEPPAKEIVEKPELRVYTDDFGSRKGDNCLVADFGGKVVGAVWTRIMNDYGHVDDETPSFAISLYKEYRGQGIGSQLMVKMLELLKWQGFEKASLAVQKANYAVKMYENVGFKTVDENAEEYIMVCEL